MLTIQQPNIFSRNVNESFNPYLDYYVNWLGFTSRYSLAFMEASYKAFETFLNIREGPAQKIQNAIRSSFDTSLRNLLNEDSFASSMADYVDSWTKVMGTSGLNQLTPMLSDLRSNASRFLEPLRDNVNRTPSEEIGLKGKFSLLHYKSKPPPKQKTPVLVIYSLINRHYILDLLPKVSVIRNLQEQGFDIYSTHWGTPASYDKDLSLENYVEDYVENAVDKIKELTGCKKVTLFGYCWGGIFALIYSAIHPENVKNLILHATPVDMEKDKAVIENWTSHLDADRLVKTCGNVPGWLLNLAFILRNPVETMLKYPRYFSEPRSIDEIQQFFAIETWLYDSRSIIGEVYREIIDQIYKKNLLIKNKMRVHSDTVNLHNISVPVLDIVGKGDDLVPPASSKSVLDVIGSTDKQLIEFPTGHVGLCISPAAHEKLWPEVGRWLAQRS